MKISGFGHTVEIDAKGYYSITNDGLGIGFSGARMEYDTLTHGTIQHDLHDLDSIEEKPGKAIVHYRSHHGNPRLEFSLRKEGVFIRFSVAHPGPMGRIVPLELDETSKLSLTGNIHHLRFMRPGYQSWSPSGSWSVLKKEPFPFLKMIERGALHPNIGFKPKAGLYHTDYATVLTDPKTGASMLIGFVTAKKYLPSLNIELASDPLGALERVTLRAFCDAEDTEAGDGKIERESELLMVAIGIDPHELWERYLDVAAREMGARVKQETPVGWCSWYHYFALISEKAVRANLEEMKKRKDDLGIEVFQIDDGYSVTGDWLEWNDKFPSGPQAIARDIAAGGFIPGLWVAPFICSRGSNIYKKHKDWLLHNDKGKPVLVGLNPWWKGKAFYALDLTNPQALGYVERVMKQVKDWGYRYVKIDFVYAALLPGKRHDPTKTGLEAYRAGLDVIRKTLGNDIFLLGCGAPMLPSVGMVDGMRVSADVAQYWKLRLSRAISVAPFDPAAENAIHGTICRSAMHRKWWINDPDCLLVRKSKSRLSLAEIQTLATAIFLSGGMALLSDDMTDLDPDRWEIIRACLPPLGKPARPVDLFEQNDPQIYYLPLPEKDRHLLALINWRNDTHTPAIDPKRLTLKGPYHAFEYWTQRYIGVIEDRKKELPFTLKPHGCALISLIPVSDEPRVIATSLHLSMGAIDVVEEKLEGNKLKVSLSLPGPRRGKVYVILPGKPAKEAIVSKEIAFMDRVQVEISV